jgi:hypothetical protein
MAVTASSGVAKPLAGLASEAAAGVLVGNGSRRLAQVARQAREARQEPAVGRAGCPQPAAAGAPGTARPTWLRTLFGVQALV